MKPWFLRHRACLVMHSDPWERINKWGRVYNFPSLLHGEFLGQKKRKPGRVLSWEKELEVLGSQSSQSSKGGVLERRELKQKVRVLAIKKNEMMPFAITQMDLEMIILREVSQTEKDKYYILILTSGILKKWYKWTYL